MNEPRPQSSIWASVVALGMLLAFIAFLIWLWVTR